MGAVSAQRSHEAALSHPALTSPMSDLSVGLEHIASVLQSIADDSAHSWISDFISFGGIFLAAILGYLASSLANRSQQKQAELIESKKRIWVFKLLKDEITLRWQNTIGKDLRTLANNPDSVKAAREFVDDCEIHADDLIVFKMVGARFYNYYFIEDPELMSQVIYGHVLFRDLVDLRRMVRKELNSKSSPTSDFSYFPIRLKERLDAIDQSFADILSKLG